MAHHASAKKALRQSIKKREMNKSRSSDMKTFVKKVEAAIAAKDLSLAQEMFKLAQSKIMKTARKNIIKQNTASRRVSNLANKVKALEAI
jgi:small subunit ribosomal protein S20